MSESGAKMAPGEELRGSPVEILSGAEAPLALKDIDALRALIRHHAGFNFAGPPINEKMGRDEVARILELYNYPPSILNEGHVATGIAEAQAGFSHRLNAASALPAYDVTRFDEAVAADRQDFEGFGLNQVEDIGKEKRMIVAKVDGKAVGMLGMRKLGLEDGRQVFEHLKASVLPDYERRGIFGQMKQKAIELNCEESPNPIWLVHSKNPKVLKNTEKYDRKQITFEDYARLRGWTMPPPAMEKIKQKWELEGWQYFLVDFQKQAKATDAVNPIE
jgi:hypothetical protein